MGSNFFLSDDRNPSSLRNISRCQHSAHKPKCGMCALEIALVCLVSALFYLMVCPEVVNLPPEHLCPEVFTDELHYIQLILEAGRVSGQPGQ